MSVLKFHLIRPGYANVYRRNQLVAVLTKIKFWSAELIVTDLTSGDFVSIREYIREQDGE